MRTLALLVSTTLAAAAGFAQGNAELSQVQTIYLMPMANGFDQYLANRLREVGQVRIVTEMSKADAVFTDKIGLAFEQRLDDIETTIKEKQAEQQQPTSPADPAKQLKLAPKTVSTVGRGKGNIFLVDRRSRMVLWSTYHKPKNVQPDTLNGVAGTVAKELARDFKGKK